MKIQIGKPAQPEASVLAVEDARTFSVGTDFALLVLKTARLGSSTCAAADPLSGH